MPQSATVTISRSITVAAGVCAPGHLGESTRYVPFELVDDVLTQAGAVQRRLRQLPSRVGVYFLLALGLFPKLGYARVWDKLVAGLAGLALPRPSEKALRELRRRLGPAPLKALFEVVAGPLAQPRIPGTCFAGMRTVAFDGLNSLEVPDTDRNRGWMGRIRYRMGFANYPTLRLMCLVETGTRGLLGATIGAAGDRDEATLARRLLGLLRPGMLVLLGRAFDATTFLTEVAATGAQLLARSKSTRKPPVRQHLPDDTKPYSPTTTGKIERWHATLRRELLDVSGPFADLPAAQAAISGWVHAYNHNRPHQAIGMATPASLFRPAANPNPSRSSRPLPRRRAQAPPSKPRPTGRPRPWAVWMARPASCCHPRPARSSSTR